MSAPARPELRLDTNQLHRLLAPVFPFVGTDDHLPVLTCVHLEVVGEYVYATATDRFKAAIHRTKAFPLDTPEKDRDETLERAQGFEVLAQVDDLRAVLACFPRTRHVAPILELVHVDNRSSAHAEHGGLLVAGGPTDPGYGRRLTLEAAHMGGTFPKVRSLFVPMLEAAGTPGETEQTTVNPAYLNQVITAAAVAAGHNVPVTVRHTAKMTHVYGGPDFLALLMQRRRMDGAPPGAAPFDRAELDTWAGFLGTKAITAKVG